jgi:stage IV sporulation protein A
MTEAAELGTRKVMEEHASIGIVVTTDGTVTDIPRSDYIQAEQRAIEDIRKTGKPFVTIINTTDPMGEAAAKLRQELKEKYGLDAAIADCQALTAEGCAALFQDLLYAFPLGEVRFYLPRWVEALEPDNAILQRLHAEMLARCAAIGTLGRAEEELVRLRELPEVRQASPERIDLATGTVHCRIRLPEQLYYDTLSKTAGVSISSDAELLRLLGELTKDRAEYARLKEALDSVRSTGYGVVMPDQEEMTLQQPELLKKGGSCGVSLKCSAPSIHMIRVDLQTELNPMVGGETQARDLLQRLGGSRDEVLDSNLFGKTVWELANDSLSSKLSLTEPQTLDKFRQSLTRILSEGAQGLICIIL